MKPKQSVSPVFLSCLFLLLLSAQGCFTIGRRILNESDRNPQPDPNAYQRILSVWENGDQADAEDLAEKALEQNDNDQKLLFFYAACMRSRFDTEQSEPLMNAVREMNPNTPEGQCAACVWDLDQDVAADQNLNLLRRIVKANPNNPIILWMMAVECRSYNMDEEGIHDYRKLLKMVGKGSSLVHTTYANLLADMGRYKEALPHYAIALHEEPESWSIRNYQHDLTEIKKRQMVHGKQ
jgi:tetratricopeptide (TPR) repeat protein